MPCCCCTPPPYDPQPPDPEQYPPAWSLWVGPAVLAVLAIGFSLYAILR